jgi:ribosome-binding protein aMBF1 (putative translation factor)
MRLAHWTFTQRAVIVILPNKPPIQRHEKPNPTTKLGDLIRAARLKIGMTRDQLSAVSRFPVYILGRWERGRLCPSENELQKLAAYLDLTDCLKS